MDPENYKLKGDPDYVTNNTVLMSIKKKEPNETKVTSDTLYRIIAEEFDKELDMRQKQLEEIEEKITKAQKLLHLIRYVLIMSYYNKKSLNCSSTNEETNLLFDSQNRIHPAIKKLLGNNPGSDIFNLSGKRKAATKICDNNEASTSQASLAKRIKLENRNNFINTKVVDSNQNCLQNRKKMRHRLVVGNISKYMPSEDDKTTHKWMMYIRGDKSRPDVSDIVDKVTFHLHPSYRPHDVVEIRSPPFHLSRRGWGEFPLRVQIYFKNSLNKPIDIVHNLKLDKTCTGRQMLGNETLIDVYLHENTHSSVEETQISLGNLEKPLKQEPDGWRNCDSNNLGSLSVKQEHSHAANQIKQDLDDWNAESSLNLHNNSQEFDDWRMQTNQNGCSTNLDAFLSTSGDSNNWYTTPDMSENSFEHNYCQESELTNDTGEGSDNGPGDSTLCEHSYSLPQSEESRLGSKARRSDNGLATLLVQDENKLIFGLDETYVDKSEKVVNCRIKSPPKATTISLSQPIKILPAGFTQVLLNNGQLVQLKVVMPQDNRPIVRTVLGKGAVPRPIPLPVIDYEKYRVKLPHNKFKNLGEALPYLFRRLPLWHSLAKDNDFKCTFPYVATSKAEFESWNVGRRAASEWCRARAVRRALIWANLPMQDKWTTKTYFVYARSHAYSPLSKPSLTSVRGVEDFMRISTCFSKSLPLNRSLGSFDQSDANVDVESDGGVPHTCSSSEAAVDISEPSLKHHCSFVKEAALDCGVILKPEEIMDGVTMNAAERMILEAVKYFADNLIRRAQYHLMCDESYSQDSQITQNEIRLALKERNEMQAIFEFQKLKMERGHFFS